MVANVAYSALNLLALQAGTWDLRTMWVSMSIIAKIVVFLLFILSGALPVSIAAELRGDSIATDHRPRSEAGGPVPTCHQAGVSVCNRPLLRVAFCRSTRSKIKRRPHEACYAKGWLPKPNRATSRDQRAR